MKKDIRLLEKAIHQMIGFSFGASGHTIEQLAKEMGLSRTEWHSIRDRAATWLSSSQMRDLDQYFDM